MRPLVRLIVVKKLVQVCNASTHLTLAIHCTIHVVSRGQTPAFSLLCWVREKGSGYPSIEILCDRITRNWRVLTKRWQTAKTWWPTNDTNYGYNSENGTWILRALLGALEMATPINQTKSTLEDCCKLVFIKSYQYITKSALFSQMEP